MTFDPSIFAVCYAPGMPGVVAVTWGGNTAYAQFFAEPQMDSMGGINLSSRALSLRGMASDFGALVPGDRLVIDAMSYQVVAGPLSDGFGEVTLYLDRARAIVPPEIEP